MGDVVCDDDGPLRVFLAALGEAARDAAFGLLQEFRRAGVQAEMDFQGRSLKAQLSQAHRLGAGFTIILGDRELETQQALLRRMATGDQEEVSLELLLQTVTNLIISEKGSPRV